LDDACCDDVIEGGDDDIASIERYEKSGGLAAKYISMPPWVSSPYANEGNCPATSLTSGKRQRQQQLELPQRKKRETLCYCSFLPTKATLELNSINFNSIKLNLICFQIQFQMNVNVTTEYTLTTSKQSE